MLTLSLYRRVHLGKPVTYSWLIGRVRVFSQKYRPHEYRNGPGPANQKLVIPELLRIYHAGKVKTAFVGVAKLVPLVSIGTNLLITGYNGLKYPNSTLQKAPWAILATAIPLLYVAAAAPFVTMIHIRLPAHARSSRDALTYFAKTAPSDTSLSLTTISWYGRPKTTWTTISELRPTKPWLGIQNIIREVRGPLVKGKWWQENPQTKFFIGKPTAKTFESTLWEKIFEKIQANGLQT